MDGAIGKAFALLGFFFIVCAPLLMLLWWVFS